MKKLFICLLFLYYAPVSIAQNSFYDAVILKRYIRPVSGKLTISREFCKPTYEINDSLFLSKIEKYTQKVPVVTILSFDNVKKTVDEVFINDTGTAELSEQKVLLSLIEESKDPSNNIDLISLMAAIDKRLETLSNFRRDTIYTILIKYFPALKDIKDPSEDDVTKIIQANPFMKNLEFTGSLQDGGQAKGLKFQSLMQVAGGLDVTKYAQGLSLFMIERAKQELNMAFFDQFKKFVEKNPEIQMMFPRSTEVLSNLLSYKYPEMIPTLRLKFEEDLKALPLNFPEVLSLPRYVTLLKDFPALRIAIKSIPMVYNIGTGVSYPIDVIKEFASLQEWQENTGKIDFQNAANLVRLTSILSESLREYGNEDFSTWISLKSFYSTILKDDVTSNIYFGLVYQLIKTEKIKFGATLLSDQIDLDHQRILTFKNYFERFLPLAEKVRINIKEIQNIKSKGDEPTFENYSNYIETGIDIIDFGFDVAKYFNSQIGFGSEITYLLRNANDLNKNIYNKQYGPAIVNSVNLLTVATEIYKDYEGSSAVNQDTVKVVKKFNTRLPGLTRYGLFITNIVEAKTPEQVQDAIESAALPVGSSAIKKYSDFNISLQSYLGVYCLFNKTTSSTINSWNSRFGITAPIGVSFSYGLRNAGSLSLFGSLIDIGAIVDYDLQTTTDTTKKTTTTTKDYKIELGQIFSPGIYFVYGAGLKLPLSLGIGAQYGPGLGKIDNGTAVINNPSWRFNIFLSVDIPMFNLFSKTWHPWKNCVGNGK